MKAVAEQSCLGRKHFHCVSRSLRSSGTAREDGVLPAAAWELPRWPTELCMSWSLPQRQRGKQWETGCLHQPEGTVSKAISWYIVSCEESIDLASYRIFFYLCCIWTRTKCRWRDAYHGLGMGTSLLLSGVCKSQLGLIFLTSRLHFPYLLQRLQLPMLFLGHCSIRTTHWVSLLTLQYLGLGKVKAILDLSVLWVSYACVHVVCVCDGPWAVNWPLLVWLWRIRKTSKQFKCSVGEGRGWEWLVRCSTYMQPISFAEF